MGTIEDTVRPHIPSGYERQARGAIAALQAREQDITDQLVRFAQDKGADPNEVKALLANLGMTLRPVVTETAAAQAVRLTSDAIRQAGQQLRDSINEAFDNAARALGL